MLLGSRSTVYTVHSKHYRLTCEGVRARTFQTHEPGGLNLFRLSRIQGLMVDVQNTVTAASAAAPKNPN